MKTENYSWLFQEHWSIEKVKAMTLEEYTSTKALSNNNRDDFTFWIENKLEPIGSIWSGSSFKFGIYRQDNNEAKKVTKRGATTRIMVGILNMETLLKKLLKKLRI